MKIETVLATAKKKIKGNVNLKILEFLYLPLSEEVMRVCKRICACACALARDMLRVR